MLTHGALFAGIGGFDLGFERAGIKTLWQVELNDYCRKVLAKNFPNAERFYSVTTSGEHDWVLPKVDIVSGGFPCQDISVAGKGAGINGKRSGLWSEYARLVGELRPKYIVVENVAALLARGMGRVLGDLAALGYDAEWECLRASDFGAPHRRERIWIVAYPQSERNSEWCKDGERGEPARELGRSGLCKDIPNSHGERRGDTSQRHPAIRFFSGPYPLGENWSVEPDVGRVANGVPSTVDRLKGLGNAIVPQIAEWIGRRIVEIENAKNASIKTV